MLAAALVHALGVVVGAVEEPGFADFGGGGEEPVGGADDFGGVVLAGDLEGEEAGGGGGEGFAAAVGFVAEGGVAFGAALVVALGLIGAFDVGDAFVDGVFGDVEAGVFGGAEGHQLPDGDGDVGVAGGGFVAPAAAVGFAFGDGLGAEDELEGAFDLLVEEAVGFVVGGVADHLGHHEGDDAVAVHAGAVGLAKVAVFVRDDVVDDVAEGVAGGLAFGGGVVGHVTDGGEAHEGERSHGRAVGGEVAGFDLGGGFVVVEVASGFLLGDEPGDGAVGGGFDFGGDGGGLLGGEEEGEEEKNAERGT